MWRLAWDRANKKRLESKREPLSLDALDLRVYGNPLIPDLKAWIFDDNNCLIGHYGEMNLGRENPIIYYKLHKRKLKVKDASGIQSLEIQKILSIWKFHFDGSKKIKRLSLAEEESNCNRNKN